MVRSRLILEKKLKNKLGASTLRTILNSVKQSNPNIWSEKRPSMLPKTCILIAVYKDVYGLSLRKLRKRIKTWWPHKRKTLAHNQKVIRHALAKWGESTVHLGTVEDWNEAVESWKRPSPLKDVNLWIDSIDFRLKGKATMSRKSKKWSYKLNSPGQRYLFLFDGKGQIRKYWGGYSPKVYDAHMVQIKKKWIMRNLQGGRIIADQHFAWGARHIHGDIKFYTKIKKPTKSGKRKERRGLSKSEKEYNKKIDQVRARMESWFGQIRQKVKALEKVWYEEPQQLDNVVSFAVGVQNTHAQQE
jgi:hypothetical protein